MSEPEKEMVWKHRRFICLKMKNSLSLPKIIAAADWSNPGHVYEVNCQSNVFFFRCCYYCSHLNFLIDL